MVMKNATKEDIKENTNKTISFKVLLMF